MLLNVIRHIDGANPFHVFQPSIISNSVKLRNIILPLKLSNLVKSDSSFIRKKIMLLTTNISIYCEDPT